MDQDKEKMIIEACKKDLSQFTELYKAYVEAVYRFAYGKLYNKTEAEEVVSETFLRALQGIQKYEYQGKPLKSWLFVIARNVIYQSYRKPEEMSFDEEWHGIEEDKILDLIADRDMVRKIEDFIRTFKPPVPEIIRLKIWEEMTFEEIAEILNKKVTSVKMAYYRALEKVQEEFMKEGVQQ